MDLTIHTSALPHDDPDASLAFYRDTLGFEVRSDVGQGRMRWITVGPVGRPDTSILLAPPAADPNITEDERRTIAEMMAKGTYGWILLATHDLDATFEKVQAGDAEVVQEPTVQPYGVRDCAFRDPAGNLIRIQELADREVPPCATPRGPAHAPRRSGSKTWRGRAERTTGSTPRHAGRWTSRRSSPPARRVERARSSRSAARAAEPALRQPPIAVKMVTRSATRASSDGATRSRPFLTLLVSLTRTCVVPSTT